MNILITGATGLIGREIINLLLQRGDIVIVVSTDKDRAKKILPSALKEIISWNEFDLLKNEKIDAVINLAGKSVGENRWTNNVKNEIYNSRIFSTVKIIELIRKMNRKPEVLINSSGVDYYGSRNEEVTEDSPPGFGFLPEVCVDWEKEAYNAADYGTRVVIIRTGFVISKNSRAVKKLVLPFKFFIGGVFGSGKQFVSWIHINDLAGIFLFVLDNYEVTGAVNAVSPVPVTMYEQCKNIGKILKKPVYFKYPPLIIKIAAGEMGGLVLNSRKAVPAKLISHGFEFKFVDSFDAWSEALN